MKQLLLLSLLVFTVNVYADVESYVCNSEKLGLTTNSSTQFINTTNSWLIKVDEEKKRADINKIEGGKLVLRTSFDNLIVNQLLGKDKSIFIDKLLASDIASQFVHSFILNRLNNTLHFTTTVDNNVHSYFAKCYKEDN